MCREVSGEKVSIVDCCFHIFVFVHSYTCMLTLPFVIFSLFQSTIWLGGLLLSKLRAVIGIFFILRAVIGGFSLNNIILRVVIGLFFILRAVIGIFLLNNVILRAVIGVFKISPRQVSVFFYLQLYYYYLRSIF